MNIIKEPLLHFLLLGAVIYGLSNIFSDSREDITVNTEIVVNQQTLINYMQYRSKMFEPGLFDKQYEALSYEQRKSLADEYLKDEILYREAIALGLEEADYVIRQRLIQKQQYLIDDLNKRPVDDDVLRAYMQANQQRYLISTAVNFTHIYFNSSERGWDAAEKAANTLLEQLNINPIPFNQAGDYGDKFPYFINYIERTQDYVSGHFGGRAAERIFSKIASNSKWYGPVKSSYGYHLILVTRKTPERPALLQEIRGRVADDWYDDARQMNRLEVIQKIKQKYKIIYDLQVEEK